MANPEQNVNDSEPTEELKLHGLVAEFETVDDLIRDLDQALAQV